MNILCIKKTFALFAILTLAACGGKNATGPNDFESHAYSSEKSSLFAESSSGTDSNGSFGTPAAQNSSSSGQSDSFEKPSTKQSSSSRAFDYEHYSGERIACKGPYSNVAVGTAIYSEVYHCEDGNTCARHTAAACTETECSSIIMHTCSDGSYVKEDTFNKRYILKVCDGGYCKVNCYNNEILDGADTLKIIECDNGSTYLRDQGIDWKKAGKAIPDTIQETPSIGYNFAVNCKYGEEICEATTDDGLCFMSTNTIECPRKE